MSDLRTVDVVLQLRMISIGKPRLLFDKVSDEKINEVTHTNKTFPIFSSCLYSNQWQMFFMIIFCVLMSDFDVVHFF